MSKYGLHLFHTKNDKVWKYVQTFTNWIPYEHRVKGYVEDNTGELKLVPIPPNQVGTYNSYTHTHNELLQ